MWKVGALASVKEGWGFNITDERDRPLVAFEYEWPRGTLKRPSKTLSQSARWNEPQAPTRPVVTGGCHR